MPFPLIRLGALLLDQPLSTVNGGTGSATGQSLAISITATQIPALSIPLSAFRTLGYATARIRARPSSAPCPVRPTPRCPSSPAQAATEAMLTPAAFGAAYAAWVATLQVYSGSGPAPVPSGEYYSNGGWPTKA